ncbi:MAG: right-handed parallel beta-helix repeat-containing protein [Thermoplasmata archaeon]
MNVNRTYTTSLLLFFGVVILTAVFITAGKANAATITVDDSGWQSYTSVQAAVNASSAGDTVYVYNGTYNEKVTISKRINLVGESNQNTIIQGTDASDSTGVYVTANYVNISNLKIDNFAYGIYLYTGSNNNIVTSNIVSDCSYYGILLSTSNNNTITSNTVSRCNHFGIYLAYAYTSSNNIISNTVSDCGTVLNCGSGILLSGSSNNNIISNTVSNCESHGIWIYSVSNSYIVSNTISNSDNGICLEHGSTNNNIVSNTVSNCDNGTSLYSSSNNIIVSNTISNSGSCGIYISGSNNNITGNTVANSNNYGVYLYSSSNNNMTSNNIYSNKQWGLYQYSGTDNTAYNNWWGGASGPYNAVSKPDGNGDNITGGVPFTPWATEPFNITMPVNYPSTPTVTTTAYTDTDGNYTINWTTSTYATNYTLYENDIEAYNGTASIYSFTNKPNGTYTYKVRAWNTNGTSAWSSTVSISVTKVTSVNAPPVVMIVSQFTGGKVNGTISITGISSDDSSVQYVQIYLDGIGWITVTGTTSWSYSLDTTKLTDGKHTIKVRSHDGTQYSTEQTIEIDVDNAKHVTESKKESKGFVPGFEVDMMFAVLGLSALIVNGRKRKR